MRILVVEDEPGIANFVRQGLGEAGLAVDLAWNGREGLDFARAADIGYLRRKIDMGESHSLLHTVRGVGYRLSTEG